MRIKDLKKIQENIKIPDDLKIEMASEQAEWEAIRINTTQAVYKNKVNLEIQEAVLKLAESKLKSFKQ